MLNESKVSVCHTSSTNKHPNIHIWLNGDTLFLYNLVSKQYESVGSIFDLVEESTVSSFMGTLFCESKMGLKIPENDIETAAAENASLSLFMVVNNWYVNTLTGTLNF